MLVLKRGQSSQFTFVFVSEGKIYDPTATIPETDILFSVVRGDNRTGPVVDGPFSFLNQASYTQLPGISGSYISTPDSNDLDILGIEGTKFLSLPGISGNYASVVDHNSLDITGDIEFVCRVKFSTFSSQQSLISKNGTTNFGGYSFMLLSSGVLAVRVSNGVSETAIYTDQTMSGAGLSINNTYWVKGTLDVDNGANQKQARFYWALDSETEPTVWNEFTVKAPSSPAISIAANALNIGIGTWHAGTTDLAKMSMYRAIIRNGIGGSSVLDADFSAQSIGTTSFVDPNGRVVTINGNRARIVDGSTHLYLGGSAGNWATAAHNVAQSITGAIELVVRARITNWSSQLAFLGKYGGTPAANSYLFAYESSNNRLYLYYSVDGVNTTLANSASISGTLISGRTYWLKVTRTAANVTSFFYAIDSETEPTSWQTIATSNQGSAGSLIASSTPIGIGAFGNTGTGYPIAGHIYRAIIRNGIGGTAVFDADFTKQIQFSTTFVEDSSTASTVTVVGNLARIQRSRDLEIVTRVRLRDWTPTSTPQTIVSRSTVADPNRAWVLSVNTNGTLQFGWYNNGLAASGIFKNSTVTPPFINNETYWIKVTFDAENSDSNIVNFFYALDADTEPVSWIKIGSSVITNGFASLPNVNSPLYLGSLGTGSWPLNGSIYRFILRNGINGKVLTDFFPGRINKGQFTYLDTYGKRWTLNGSATFNPSSRTDLISIDRTNNYYYTLNYEVPDFLFEGVYSVIAQSANTLDTLSISAPFQVQGEPITLNPSIAASEKTAVLNYKPTYQQLNQANTSTILLIGHADNIGLNDPIRIQSIQSAVDILGSDLNSPLLRGVYDAYAAGARDIIICAAAPMIEYVEKASNRLESTIMFDLESATPSSYTFYQKYYSRLATTYSAIESLDFVDYIVPLETSIFRTGGIDFVTQLANYLSDFHDSTGYVQLGIIGSKSDGISPSHISELEAIPAFKNKFTTKDYLGNVLSDKGRYVIPVYGEGVYQHSQLKTSYTSPLSASVAGMLASTRLNLGLIRTRIPGITSVFGSDLSQSDLSRLDSLGINTIYRGKKARRSIPFEVYLSNEYTMADPYSTLSKAAQMRLIARVVSEVRGFSYSAIGKFNYDVAVSKVRNFLESLKKENIILNFTFNVEVSQDIIGKLIFHIQLISSLGIKKLNFAISTGPGV